jgi:hypothetical protein
VGWGGLGVEEKSESTLPPEHHHDLATVVREAPLFALAPVVRVDPYHRRVNSSLRRRYLGTTRAHKIGAPAVI